MPRRVLKGTVVSAKGDKTITVSVVRRVMHPVYKKYINKSKKFAAHDAENAAKEGDIVEIQECKPISKSKKWELIATPNEQK
jgi:small subunit ribosomal protein S17